MKVKLLTAYSGGPYKWGEDLGRSLRSRGVKVSHVRNRASMMANCAQQFGVDVVHSTIPFPVKLWRKPLVVTIKGDFTAEDNMFRRFYPHLVRQATVLTTHSEFMKERIGIPSALVIPNAIIPDEVVPVVHGERQRLNIATVANLFFPGKAEGLARLFDLMAVTDLPEFRHIVVGDGPFLQGVKDRARAHGLSTRFSGFLHDARMVLSNSDLFLYYSLHDHFPNVILEAMAHGLQVLTYQVGAVSEIIRDGVDGFVAQSDAEYVERLETLIADPELRATIGTNARRAVEERFNWDKVLDQWLDIYEGLCV